MSFQKTELGLTSKRSGSCFQAKVHLKLAMFGYQDCHTILSLCAGIQGCHCFPLAFSFWASIFDSKFWPCFLVLDYYLA